MFVINQGYLRIIRVLISLVNEDEQNLIMIDIVKVGCLEEWSKNQKLVFDS